MGPKNNFIAPKKFFIIAQIIVLFVAMSVLFSVMVLGYKDKVLRIVMSRLDTSAETMVSQLKANQVPFFSGAGGHGVFIINQKDGTMVVERQGDTDIEQKLWERYRTKFIYEMQKQKRGWIVYPDKNILNLNQQQKILRYLSVDELNWILAIEVTRPTELELLQEAISPSSYLLVFLIFIGGSICLWFMTNQYFFMIRRQANDDVENKLMSLSGEDKVWEKFKPGPALPIEDIPGSIPEPKAKPEEPVQSVDERDALFAKKSPVIQKEDTFKPTEPLERPSEDIPSPEDRSTININNINSPVLRKIIQQFREK